MANVPRGMEETIKEGLMVKRSQNKKIYTPVNYKQRWFVLNRKYLIYYDSDNEEKRKERGRVYLENVHYIEGAPANNNSEDNKSSILAYPIQVGYEEAGQDYNLYLYAPKEEDRIGWIIALRKVCSLNKNLRTRYHKGFWNGRKWTCCKATLKNSKYACEPCSSWVLINEETENKENQDSAQTTPIMPGGATPGTPSSKQKEKAMIRPKVVVALYNYKAIETGDLSLEKNAEYEVVDDGQEHWWKVRDSHGNIGFIPSNYVKEKELIGLQQYEWYVNDMSRQRSESLLKQEDKEGCFVVRNSSTKGLYTLSLYTKV